MVGRGKQFLLQIASEENRLIDPRQEVATSEVGVSWPGTEMTLKRDRKDMKRSVEVMTTKSP